MNPRIVDYSPEYRDAFRKLNLEWIERFFAVEESDRTMLGDPEGTIIDRGGFVFVALDGGGFEIEDLLAQLQPFQIVHRRFETSLQLGDGLFVTQRRRIA